MGTQVRFRPDCGWEGAVLGKSVSRAGPRRIEGRGEGCPYARPSSERHLCVGIFCPYNNHVKYIQLLPAFFIGN